MDLINSLKNTARSVEKRVVSVATSKPVAQAVGFAQDTFQTSRREVTNVGKAIVGLPAAVGTWEKLGHAAVTGERTLLPGHLPAYTPLDPQALAAAVEAGKGQKARQPFLQDAGLNGYHEPVSIYLTGSQDQIRKLLERQGWTQNDPRSLKNYARQFLAVLTHYDKVADGPVSPMLLDGKEPEMAFSKNVDYNLGRDHMRVYKTGTDPKTGQDVWAIAASRDVAATVTLKKPETHGILPWKWDWQTPGFGHETDPNVDKERDLIMNDLLASGEVADFKAVEGVRKDVSNAKQPDGSYIANGKPTDGRVYKVALTSR